MSDPSPDRPTTWFVCAHPSEGESLIRAGLPVHVLGVGKVASTLGLSRLLAANVPDLIVVVGVAGAFPARHRPSNGTEVGIGSLVVVRDSRLADEGVQTESGFTEIGEVLGDSEGAEGRSGPFAADPALTHRVAEHLGVPQWRAATVSTCSGNEPESVRLAKEHDLETMESAAIASVCHAWSVPFVEIRSISNWTGDRERGAFDFATALTSLHEGVMSVWSSGLLDSNS